MTTEDNVSAAVDSISGEVESVEDSEGTVWIVDDDPGHETVADEDAPGEGLFVIPRLRGDLSRGHMFGLAISGIVIAAFATFGILPWWIALGSLAVAATTLVEGWQRATRIGALLIAVFFLASVVSSLTGGSSAEPVVLAPTEPAPVDLEPVTGSLGFRLEELPELWNTVEAPPKINGGLIRQNEVGEYDTFVYRFGHDTQVAGAFDPANEAVYALLVSGPFDNPATSQLYLHLCYVVAPFSQECIDSYFERGLDSGTLEDFTDQVREAEWTVDGQTWRLEIGQNLLAIRVYGADAAA